MKRYGKTLMHHVPDGTTSLLKDLCTDYQPKRETADRDPPQRGQENKVSPSGTSSPTDPNRTFMKFLKYTI